MLDLDTLSKLYPILIGFVGLVFWLAKSYADIESLKEKVRVLFELHNDNQKDK